MWRVLVGTSTQISSRSFFSCAAPGDVQWHVGGTALRCAVHWGTHTPQRLQLMPSVSTVLRGLTTNLAPPVSAVGSSHGVFSCFLFSLPHSLVFVLQTEELF